MCDRLRDASLMRGPIMASPSAPVAPGPVIAIHAGAGRLPVGAEGDERRRGLLDALAQAAGVLEGGGSALDGAQAAVAHMEDRVDLFNAGRGSVLCADGTVEMAAALMRGTDQAAGAVAAVSRIRQPVLGARAVLEGSPHVLMIGGAAEAVARDAGVEVADPSYFITDRQRARLREAGSTFEGGTVGAVCRDARGELAAATSTGGMRGQAPGRIGDSPLIVAGTWADRAVAVSCTGDGEVFIRVGVARLIAALVGSGCRWRRRRPRPSPASTPSAATAG
jgi:beta-aspartyl-peptidase (threonine type)